MDESDEFCIVETDEGSIPDHWTHVGVLDDGRRVMDTFETEQKASHYLEEMYGMYKTDAEVRSLDSVDVSWV